MLAPINGPLGNITEYFDTIVAPVYQKLLDTFLGRPDRAWWNDIVLRQAKVGVIVIMVSVIIVLIVIIIIMVIIMVIIISVYS